MGCSFKFAFRISTHAPTKGATVSVHDKSHWRKKFQPTLPQRERHCNYRSSMPRTDFNPRSHKGSDTIRNKPRFFCIHFNPRSHKGSDDRLQLASIFVVNFNPRSHKGSDNTTAELKRQADISTHAPTKGATAVISFDKRYHSISTHAPTKGATRLGTTRLQENLQFQPTLPQRERH